MSTAKTYKRPCPWRTILYVEIAAFEKKIRTKLEEEIHMCQGWILKSKFFFFFLLPAVDYASEIEEQVT